MVYVYKVVTLCQSHSWRPCFHLDLVEGRALLLFLSKTYKHSLTTVRERTIVDWFKLPGCWVWCFQYCYCWRVYRTGRRTQPAIKRHSLWQPIWLEIKNTQRVTRFRWKRRKEYTFKPDKSEYTIGADCSAGHNKGTLGVPVDKVWAENNTIHRLWKYEWVVFTAVATNDSIYNFN